MGYKVKKIYVGTNLVRPPIPPYLCFTANTASSTIKLTKTGSPTSVSLEKSTNGSNWTTYTIGDTITLSNIGDKVFFRNSSGTDTGFSTGDSDYYKFVMTGSIAGSGDTTSLLNKNGTTTLSNYCFNRLFKDCTILTTAPKLPATTLNPNCYNQMFYGCSNLTTAPELPAMTVPDYCYGYMFYGCTSLTTVPSLPATTLARACYYNMFEGCTSLNTLPKLPATTLTDYCYYYMFKGCSNIKISSTQTGEYQTPYRIPTTGTGTTASYALQYMFDSTGGTYKGTPGINTTYYTSNTVV